VWALWHTLVDFRASFESLGVAWLFEFAVFYLATLTPYRVLMTWVHANTRSLLLAMLMHASYTGWLLVLFPITTPTQGIVWQAALAAGLWALVAGIRRYGPALKRSTCNTNASAYAKSFARKAAASNVSACPNAETRTAQPIRLAAPSLCRWLRAGRQCRANTATPTGF
jgi:hypothetical protein